jgi:hypothetical protein
MDSPTTNPDSPLDPDEAAYPCKGCGEVSMPATKCCNLRTHLRSRFSKKEKHSS